MCVLKNALIFISSVPRLILCSKGLGHFLLLSTVYFPCFLLSCCLNQNPLKSYLSVLAVFTCPRSLINTYWSSLGSTLLLTEDITIDSLHLWVIKKCLLVPLPGSVALLVSEAGKETFILCVMFLFWCCYFQSLWKTLLLVRCL